MDRRRIRFLIKLAVSCGIVALIYFKIVHRQGSAELSAHLRELSWPWIAAAAGMQACAMLCSVLRWDRLLVGQGIGAPFRYLLATFMVGRFFSSFTPGGWTGLN